jgi:hypothetical protein
MSSLLTNKLDKLLINNLFKNLSNFVNFSNIVLKNFFTLIFFR